MIWHGPATAVENSPAPGLAEDVGRLEQLGGRYRAAGDAAGLAAVEKKLADVKTDRPAALVTLGRLLHYEGKDAEAAAALEQALALRPNDFDIERELGPVYNTLGQYEKAALLMEKALKQRPQEYRLRVELATCYRRMGRLEQAKEAFARAKSLNSREAEAYIKQGYTYLDSGQYAQGKQEFEALIAVDTANPLGYHHLGTYFFKQHQFHEAEEYYRKAAQMLEADPLHDSLDLVHALTNLGAILKAQRKFAEAEVVFRKGLEKAGFSPHQRVALLLYLGELFIDEGKPAVAEQFYKEAEAVCAPALYDGARVQWVGAISRLGLLYVESGRKPEAEALADRIGKLEDRLSIEEYSIDHLLPLGEFYAALGQSANAAALLRRIVSARGLSAHPLMVQAETALAGLYQSQGRLVEAERLFKQVLAACESGLGCPYQVLPAATALGDIYVAQERKPEAGALTGQLERAYASVPVNAESIGVVLWIARLYLKLGDSSKAEAPLLRILAARGTLPADPVMAEAEAMLAGLYEAQGQWEKLEALYLEEIEAFKGHGDKAKAAGTLARLTAVYEEEGKAAEAAAARRQAEALRAQSGKS